MDVFIHSPVGGNVFTLFRPASVALFVWRGNVRPFWPFMRNLLAPNVLQVGATWAGTIHARKYTTVSWDCSPAEMVQLLALLVLRWTEKFTLGTNASNVKCVVCG